VPSRETIQAGRITTTESTTDLGSQQGDVRPIDAPNGNYGVATTGPVTISSPGAAGAVESGDHTYSTAAPYSSTMPPAMPIPFAATAQRTFAAAGDQFNALTRFGTDRAPLSPKDRAQAIAEQRKVYEGIFVRGGVIEFDQHRIHDLFTFLRADEAIRAKAVALGYGAAAQAVPVTSVPGGYVGRFGGHDIYAATT
jgi:hypothetical protein